MTASCKFAVPPNIRSSHLGPFSPVRLFRYATCRAAKGPLSMSASPTSRSWLRSILTGLVLTSALVGVAASQALAAGVPGEILFGPASTVGSPFGGHWGLDAATNASGEVTLAWGGPSLSETGDLTNNVLTASVAPGGASTPIRIA